MKAGMFEHPDLRIVPAHFRVAARARRYTNSTYRVTDSSVKASRSIQEALMAKKRIVDAREDKKRNILDDMAGDD